MLLQIPDIETQTFNGLRHYNCNGVWYPSITSILSSEEKEYLKDWKNRLGEENAKIETKRCTDRGTAVHEMCELFLLHKPIDFTQYQLPHVKMFNKMKFVLNRISNIYALEAALYSDILKVAGRVDCIAFYDNVLSIIDFKTSNSMKNDDMCYDYFLQETFYSLALLEQYGIEIKQIVTIIGSENQVAPQIIKKQITPYIVPLANRVEKFYKTYNIDVVDDIPFTFDLDSMEKAIESERILLPKFNSFDEFNDFVEKL